MKNLLQITLQNRKFLYGILKHTPKEELLHIPLGYRNSIYWNIGHVVVTQQRLTYGCSNLPMLVPTHLIEKFKKGTVPDGQATEQEMEELSSFLFSTIEQTAADYEAEVFKTYDQFTTATKTEIKSIKDALVFNLFHEGLHLGVILSLQKAIGHSVKP